MKKTNYSIKFLSLALLMTSAALVNTSSIFGYEQDHKLDIAVQLLQNQIDDPKYHWETIATCICICLKDIDPNAAQVFHDLKKTTNVTFLKTMLFVKSKNMSERFKAAVQRLGDKVPKLTAAFTKSLAKPRLADDQLEAYINTFIK